MMCSAGEAGKRSRDWPKIAAEGITPGDVSDLTLIPSEARDLNYSVTELLLSRSNAEAEEVA